MDLVELRQPVLMSGDELVAALDAVHATRGRLDSYELGLIGRLHEMGHAQEIGAHDTSRFLATRYRVDAAAARRKVDLAAALHKYPAVVAALPDPFAATSHDGATQYSSEPCDCGDECRCVGECRCQDECRCVGECGCEGECRCDGGALPVLLHLDQARVVVEVLEGVPARAMVPVEDLRVAEAELVKAGRHLPPSDLRKLGNRIRDRLDTDGPEPAEDKARQREALRLTNAEGGVKFSGFLAAENAELFTGAIRAGSKPRKTIGGELDPRPRDLRQADALKDILNSATATGDLPANGGIKPHITVTIGLDDLVKAGRQATGDLTYGTGLSASAVRRLACDAGLIPMVLGSDSRPLDVGREQRFVTGPIRAALIQRDKGCVVCGAPPIFCDAHHLVSWLDGGQTCLSNLVLLCRVHHTGLHQGHWKVTITDNQVTVVRPAWAEPEHQRPLFRTTSNPPADVPIRRTADVPIRRTADVPIRRTADVAVRRTADLAVRRPGEHPEAAARDRQFDPISPAKSTGRPRPARAWPLAGDHARLGAKSSTTFDPWGDQPAARAP